MNGAEILTTIAQLGLGISGFSGIAIAFNRQPGRLSEVEAFRVLILFANSFAAVFLSLLPFAFYYLGWPDAVVWRAASGLCGVFEVIFLVVLIPPTRKFLRERPELFNRRQLAFVFYGHVMNLLLQLGNAFALLGPRNLSLFLLGLLWLLFHGVFQFGRILFVQPMSGGAVSRTHPE